MVSPHLEVFPFSWSTDGAECDGSRDIDGIDLGVYIEFGDARVVNN